MPLPVPDEEAPTQELSVSGAAAASAGEAWPPRSGEVLSSRYEVKRTIGHGGMGVVVEAMDLALLRPVAIKILKPSFATTGEWHERFLREARSMASLDHPNIVPIYDLGVARSRHYFVMKLLDGESVFARLARGPIAVPEAIQIAIQVLDGLAYMHARGVVHRDIKAGNILLTRDGPVIVDFGILRQEGGPRLTQLGENVGTVGYIAPELLRSEPGDPRTDLYSLGVTLFEMLTAELPFHGPSPMETLEMQLHDEAPAPSSREPSVPRALDEIVLRALSRSPADRYASAAEMRSALRRLAERPPEPIRPGLRRWATHIFALVLGAALCLIAPLQCGQGAESEPTSRRSR